MATDPGRGPGALCDVTKGCFSQLVCSDVIAAGILSFWGIFFLNDFNDFWTAVVSFQDSASSQSYNQPDDGG